MTAELPSKMAHRREQMISDLRGRGIGDERVLAAMNVVPREEFVPEALYENAYDDSALAIGYGQTISQPFVVALMLQLAELGPDSRMLEVGTGSGYAAAVLSRMCAGVVTIERQPDLFALSRERLGRLRLGDIDCRLGDGTVGVPEEAPFDAILVAAGTDQVPEPLLAQLRPGGGRLIIPVGPQPSYQRLLRIVRLDETRYESSDFGPVSFVPLVPG